MIDTSINNSSIVFNYRGVFTKNIKNADGEVSIPLTGLGVIKALYISTDKQISVKLNSGADLAVAKTLFTELNSLSALSVSCLDVAGASVNIIVWGS
jgi:hypothetical protein